ncbi:hypothetical protein CONPUDRAFT_68664 [Coniophora puteana RWD-64-598 SS2]|uniref:Class I glutamine amidotransferase-like protein n=1 Tax=Coniophora puteana (strain RWD-64-598) TaxID=741705 RepID=A0A5M3N418_CONPW|nr:uncharacterized protein CONPUDRAFT_68664 [Coniophora puteana RWD-64-598 SS2]EIW86048.1 hypothetical protein CONPUDRAFT_68664 [Coniophora puteana RWD-64-598 SS2]
MSTKQHFCKVPKSTTYLRDFPQLSKLPFPHIPQIAFINCDDTKPEFVNKFGTVSDVFYNLLKNYLQSLLHPRPACEWFSNDGWFDWHCFDAQKGQLPILDGTARYDCIIVGGSSSCVNDSDEWICNLSNLIYEAALMHSDIKLIGVCFGHQLICKVLYSHVRVVKGPWEVGPYTIKLNQAGSLLFGGVNTLNLNMLHADSVCSESYETRLRHSVIGEFRGANASPACFLHSDRSPVSQPITWGNTVCTEATTCQGTVVFDSDLGAIGNADGVRVRVFTMQGHPETTESMAELLLELFTRPGEDKEAIPECVAEEARKRMACSSGVLDLDRVAGTIWAVASGARFPTFD